MKQTLFNFFKQHTAFVIGASISIIFLIVFFSFQHNKAEVLNLETRWLIVSGVPILVALLIGGYIKSFKGFGIELEASLEKPISNLSLTATEAITHIKGDEKKGIAYLQTLSPKEKSTISRLKFIQGKVDYYDTNLTMQYFRELKNLKYIEIYDTHGKFIGLIPIDKLGRNQDNSSDNNMNNFILRAFINALENNDILSRYKDGLLTVTVQEDIEIIEALKIMKKKQINKLIVVDDNDNVIGLLTLRSVENKIIENVLQAQESA